MRTFAEIELLRRITAEVETRLEVDRPRLERMVRAQHRGDERTTELALQALAAEIEALPEAILDQLRATEKQEVRH